MNEDAQPQQLESSTKLTGRLLTTARVSFVILSAALLVMVGSAYITEMAPSMADNRIGVDYGECPDKPDCYSVTGVEKGSLADRVGLEVGQQILMINDLPPHEFFPKNSSGLIWVITVVDETEDDGEKNHKMIRDPSQVNLMELGMSYEQSAWVILFTNNLILLVSVGVGTYLAVRRSDDWMALVAGMALIALGTLLSDYYYWVISEDHFIQDISLYHFIFTALIGLLFLLLMPDGRMFPQRGWILLIITFFFNLPIFGEEWEDVLYLAATFGSLLAVIGAQIYRYIKMATPEQRQQIKWILYGSLMAISIRLAAEVSWYLLEVRAESSAGTMTYTVISDVISQLGLLIIPITILFSAMRYRLWDIDAAINRTLVYTMLTLVLGSGFLAAFFGIQAILESMIGSDEAMLSAGVAGVAVVGLFSPARTRLRAFVDKNVYGIELDYENAIKEYHRQAARATKKSDRLSNFGEYTGLSLLGRGGMGEVYIGQHSKYSHPVAIKVLPKSLTDDPDILSRFQREAETIAKLDHPNIVSLLEAGEYEGNPYIVMEYIEGETLHSLLKTSGRIPFTEALPLLNDIGSALAYAHKQDVVHRDIKPGNVMVTNLNGAGKRAVLMDFGIAKLVTSTTRLTQTGSMMGTMDYISPEQIQGAKDVDSRSDQYSFAVMVYEVLVGELPFLHEAPVAIIMSHLNEPPPDPRLKAPEVSAKTTYAIMRGMSKFPEVRFDTIEEFMAYLE